jgi:hypothetical protein
MGETRVDYDALLIEAAQSVLLELARTLHDYFDGIVLVGGWVPGLLFGNSEQAHIGSMDVDLALDQNTIQEVGYRSIMQLLVNRGYQQGDQPFIFYRVVTVGDREIKVEVDFLAAEYGGTGKKHRTQTVQDMHPRKARGCDLAFQDPIDVTIEGSLPGGGRDRATIRVASVVPFLMMKAQALVGRLKEKDAYDIYYCLTNYPGGLDLLVEVFRPHAKEPLVSEGLSILAEKFESPDYVGPNFVADFLEVTDPDERAFLQRDAFERVNYLLTQLGRVAR